jgi:hypothetical protein
VELIILILMIAAGVAVAAIVIAAVGLAQREASWGVPQANANDLERIATSLLHQVLLFGGARSDEALREIRRRSGLLAPVVGAIDVTSWGERFAHLAAPAQRHWLLETAVQLVAARSTPVPLRQYTALLDLSFALGFQTDALAKLREQYGFDYVDPARDARPREADRAGGATALFVRDTRSRGELLRVLEIEETNATRQEIISAYRRLAARHHPDRVHGEPADAQAAAAARFIEITRAYEALLATDREE